MPVPRADLSAKRLRDLAEAATLAFCQRGALAKKKAADPAAEIGEVLRE